MKMKWTNISIAVPVGLIFGFFLLSAQYGSDALAHSKYISHDKFDKTRVMWESRFEADETSQHMFDQVSARHHDTSGPYEPDEHTLLLLHFDGEYTGAQDELGTATGTAFVEGYYGQGVSIDNSDTLTYTTMGNLNVETGTVEFWVRPNWDGDDGQMHILFETGDTSSSGIQIGKDGVGTLQFILWTSTEHNAVIHNVSDWQSGKWHHLAASWQNNEMSLFIDGRRRDNIYTAISPEELGKWLYIGSSPSLGWQADAVFDELRIRDIPLSMLWLPLVAR